jgi:hypothetical protein
MNRKQFGVPLAAYVACRGCLPVELFFFCAAVFPLACGWGTALSCDPPILPLVYLQQPDYPEEAG